ncbi:MAG: DUF4388 domain-containing protein [Meiothermus sp.]|nr:DUF4388 domain-containing protein [Meiothermus sp.]
MEGTFELLGPIEILQLLAQARQTGVFRVPGGEVYLERGQPVHAQYRGQVGREGLFQILALKEGKFRYLPGERPPCSSLEGPLDHYLLEAIRSMDTWPSLSPFDLVGLARAEGSAHLALSPEELELLPHLSTPVSLFELVARSGARGESVQRAVARLARLGLVRITRRTPHPARLTIDRLEGSLHARLDTQLLRAWRDHYGPFSEVEVRADGRTLRLSVEPKGNLGPRLLLSSDALFFYNLRVGQEVLVWPSL